MKKDLIHRRSWPTKAEARTAVFAYIETFYNRRRRHCKLGMLCRRRRSSLLTVLFSLRDACDVRRALTEAARVTAPGARVVIWEPRVPTLNRAARLVRESEVSAALGPEVSSRPITLLPPLARRLGRATPRLYPALARLPALRSHRLTEWCRPHPRGQT